ncbi:unnamed protein product [Didymodactylos carnosus]|uniref:DNA mismatch repair proteins mutS family domain-containing protein n=1 Tax=Didymodactylos carnosus TaxID=1234261 RepID=A0A813ZV79_9BILA|nr:unnamed protein product [Didymodactylos carnosus]CAF3685853.1 unnamed protein product [Didymodactylos carnosus]
MKYNLFKHQQHPVPLKNKKSSSVSSVKHLTLTDNTSVSFAVGEDDLRYPVAIAAICTGRGEAKGTVGVACYDFSSATLILSEFSDFLSFSRLLCKLETLKPNEHSLTERTRLTEAITNHHADVRVVNINRKYFSSEYGLDRLRRLVTAEYNEEFALHRLQEKYYCTSACAALLRYLEYQYDIFFFEKSIRIQVQSSEKCAFFDLASARYLGILVDFAQSNQCGLQPGFQSLFSILQATKTKMGARTLRANLMEPLIDLSSIYYRQDAVENFMDDEKFMYQIQTILIHFSDVERTILACIQENPSHTLISAEKRLTVINQLRHILDISSTLKNILEQGSADLMKNLCTVLTDKRFQLILDILDSRLNTEQTEFTGFIGTKLRRIFTIRVTYDSLRADVIELIGDVEAMERDFGERFNVPVRYSLTNTRGFTLEIGCEFKGLLPPNVISIAKREKSTVVTTLHLAHLSDRFELLYHDICLISDKIILDLLTEIRPYFGSLYKLVEALSILDMIQAFAEVSRTRDYVRPLFADYTKIVKARHPVIDLFGVQKPIPNDIDLFKELNIHIVTGPNMSGKSTYLRQIALLQVLAQIGCFVPAEQAKFRIVTEIFSKIRQHDNLFSGQSTFSSEMNHIAFILRCMTPNSLVILDEVCSSTSANEGLALATSIIEYLAKTSQAFVIFATHFQQLTSISHAYKNISNYHFDVVYNETNEHDSSTVRFHRKQTNLVEKLREQNAIIYDYQLKPGACKEVHYGIALASQIEDLHDVVEMAKMIAQFIIEKQNSISDSRLSVLNLLMKRVIIMKAYCDLIYDAKENQYQFIEQQKIYLELFQQKMKQYWSESSDSSLALSISP